jgi:hypothetical protein
MSQATQINSITGEETIILSHSKNKKILESIFLAFWIAIAVVTIIMAILIENQGWFFKITLVILALLLVGLFLESTISKFANKIILTPDKLKARNYYQWHMFNWPDINCLEINQKSVKSFRGEEEKSKIISLEIHLADGTIYIYPLYKFSHKKAEKITNTIKHYFELNTDEPIDEERIKIDTSKKTSNVDDYILPKVEEYEIEN